MGTLTDNLNLYKTDMSIDGDDLFDFDRDLNQNWDKIDEAFGGGLANTDLSNISEIGSSKLIDPTTGRAGQVLMTDGLASSWQDISLPFTTNSGNTDTAGVADILTTYATPYLSSEVDPTATVTGTGGYYSTWAYWMAFSDNNATNTVFQPSSAQGSVKITYAIPIPKGSHTVSFIAGSFSAGRKFTGFTLIATYDDGTDETITDTKTYNSDTNILYNLVSKKAIVSLELKYTGVVDQSSCGGIYNFKVQSNMLEFNTTTPIMATTAGGESFEVTYLAPIDMTSKANGIYNIDSSGEIIGNIYRQKSKPSNCITGDIWLDTSVKPLRAFKYDGADFRKSETEGETRSDKSYVESIQGADWQVYNRVPLGSVTLANSLITKVETFDFNDNGNPDNAYTLKHQAMNACMPDYTKGISKAPNINHTTTKSGLIWVYANSQSCPKITIDTIAFDLNVHAGSGAVNIGSGIFIAQGSTYSCNVAMTFYPLKGEI